MLSVEDLGLSVEMLGMREGVYEEALPFRQRSELLEGVGIEYGSMGVFLFHTRKPNA